ETYESFQLFESSLFDHQVLRRLVAFMYEEPATIIYYFKDDAIVAVDEYNRIKETETNLISEADEFMQGLIESGKGFMGQNFLQYDGFESLLKQYPVTYFTLFTTTMSVELNDIIKFSCKPVQQFYGQYDIMRSEFQHDDTVIVVEETELNKEAIQSMLNALHIPTLTDTPSPQVEGGSAIITEGSLSEGFELPYMQLAVVTERELFKSKQKKKAKQH